MAEITNLLYRDKAPGHSQSPRSRTFFIEAKLLATVTIAEITNLLYRGKAPGHSQSPRSRTFFIEAKLLATVMQSPRSRTFFIEAKLLATVTIAEITNLLYRGKAPGHSQSPRSRTFFIEAKLLATVNRRDHEPSLWRQSSWPLATVTIAEITNLLYRDKAPGHSQSPRSRTFFLETKAPGHSQSPRSRTFFIEAKLLATVNRRDHEPSL